MTIHESMSRDVPRCATGYWNKTGDTRTKLLFHRIKTFVPLEQNRVYWNKTVFTGTTLLFQCNKLSKNKKKQYFFQPTRSTGTKRGLEQNCVPLEQNHVPLGKQCCSSNPGFVLVLRVVVFPGGHATASFG